MSDTLMNPGGVTQVATDPAPGHDYLHLAERLQECASSMSAGVSQPAAAPQSEDDYLRGYVRALRDMADHLRHGDYLPGGLFDGSYVASA